MSLEFGLEKNLIKSLKDLKKNYGLKGIKAEFEAEGSSLSDINRLRRITSKTGVQLYVKIGGVEALRDVYDCYESGIDGIIAPMVETSFAAKKFLDTISKFHFKNRPKLTINIETITGFKNLDSILKILSGNLNNITIGRSDLVGSLFNKHINVDSKIIINLIKKIFNTSKKYNIPVTVGGGVSNTTFEIFKKDSFLKKNIKRIETRKVIFDLKKFTTKKNAIEKAMEFEKLYILSKKEFIDLRMNAEIIRLSKLTSRI